MPAWDLLPMRQYRAHNWHCFDRIAERQPYAVIYTSLGCPFRCSFCCINTLFGKPRIRYRDPARVVAEIDWLVHNHGVRNIKIIDEMFVLNEDHVLRFCDLLIERGHDLNFWAYARVNTAKRSMLQRMKQAGINWVAYGFESASERVLRDATKGYQPAKVMDVVKMTRDEGLAICANFIFGLPEDDHQTMEQTLAMAMEINGEWANLYSAMAFPGSQLYEQALANGWPLPETWQGYSQYAFECLPLPTRHLSAAEVLRFRDAAFVRYYSNPAYLAAMRARYGAEVEQHLRDMLATSLRRKYA
jgi:radical SAM superfamily enzyme YgiQ (UPF0313 family)